MKIGVIALLGLLLMGCVADPIKPKFMQPGNVESITIGKTTAADVEALLGRPQEVRTVTDEGNSSTVWQYQYIQQGTYELVPSLRESLSKPAIRSLLKVQFDRHNTVQKLERVNQEIRSPEEGGLLVP